MIRRLLTATFLLLASLSFAQGQTTVRYLPRLQVTESLQPPSVPACTSLTNQPIGAQCYRTTDNVLYTYNGNAWSTGLPACATSAAEGGACGDKRSAFCVTSTDTVLYCKPSTLTWRSIGGLGTSGVLTLTQGGTGTSSLTAGQCVQVNAAGTGLETSGSVCGTSAGNVAGPGSASDGALVLFNGTTGKIIKAPVGGVTPSVNSSGQLSLNAGSPATPGLLAQDIGEVSGNGVRITTQTGDITLDADQDTSTGVYLSGGSSAGVQFLSNASFAAGKGLTITATGELNLPSGTTPPACNGSELFIDTDAANGAGVCYCKSGTMVCTGAGSGTGDVLGDSSSIDNAIPRFNGTGGKQIQQSYSSSGVTPTISDAGLATIPGGVTANGPGFLAQKSDSGNVFNGVIVDNSAASGGAGIQFQVASSAVGQIDAESNGGNYDLVFKNGTSNVDHGRITGAGRWLFNLDTTTQPGTESFQVGSSARFTGPINLQRNVSTASTAEFLRFDDRDGSATALNSFRWQRTSTDTILSFARYDSGGSLASLVFNYDIPSNGILIGNGGITSGTSGDQLLVDGTARVTSTLTAGAAILGSPLPILSGGTGRTSFTASRCVQTDASGNLESASAACGSGGGGSSVILDLANDAVNESTGITKIATVSDTNAIFSEPTADVLRITLSNDWPKADLADALVTNPTDCGGAGTGFYNDMTAAGVPTCAKVDLASSSHITGTAAVGNGGTGASSFTANKVVITNTAGTALVNSSDGLTWTEATNVLDLGTGQLSVTASDGSRFIDFATNTSTEPSPPSGTGTLRVFSGLDPSSKERLYVKNSTDATARQVLLTLGEGASTHGILLWGDGTDAAFDTGTEVCAARGLTCIDVKLTNGTDSDCTTDLTAQPIFYAMCGGN